MTSCPHQSKPPGKDTGRRICAIGLFAGRPWAGNCSTCSRTPGPGSCLKKILSRFGLEPTPGCHCAARAAEMDSRGPDWCQDHIEDIVGWLGQESARRSLPFNRPAARILIRLAIRKSRTLQTIGTAFADSLQN